MATLHTALDSMRFRQFSILLELGTDVNLRDHLGWTPLIKSCHVKDIKQAVKCCNKLLDNGADVKICDNKGCSALIHAVKLGKLRLVKELMKNDDFDLKATDNDGNCALHHAVLQGHILTAQFLAQNAKKYNVVIDVTNNAGFTPLLMACKQAHLEIARTLANEYRASQTIRDTVHFRCAREWLATRYEITPEIDPFDDDTVLKDRKRRPRNAMTPTPTKRLTLQIDELSITKTCKDDVKNRDGQSGEYCVPGTCQTITHISEGCPRGNHSSSMLKEGKNERASSALRFSNLFDIYSEQQTHAYRAPASPLPLTQSHDYKSKSRERHPPLSAFRDAVGKINALDKVVRIISTKNSNRQSRRSSLKTDSISPGRGSKRSLSTSSIDSFGSGASRSQSTSSDKPKNKKLLKRRSTTQMRLAVPQISLDEVFK